MEYDTALLDVTAEFLSAYYRQDIAELAGAWPARTHLEIDAGDIYQHNPALADDLRAKPELVLSHLERAVADVDIPTHADFDGLDVRLTGLNDTQVHLPGDLGNEYVGELVGVRGVLERITTAAYRPDVLVWECKRCGNNTPEPQTGRPNDAQEPHKCRGCERQGPFTLVESESEWSDYARVRIQSQPHVDPDAEGKVTGYVVDDLIERGGESGLMGRVGEPVTATGIVHAVQRGGKNSGLFDPELEVLGVEFEHDDGVVNVADHREEFEVLADRADAVDCFAESIAPQLHATDAWEAAMEFAVAYLFGAPRIDVPQGPTYRGDLHFLMVSDYGMGKSTFKEDIEAYSPKCISKSTTALSSDVGLTAAAVKDDFGEGQWTIKPGLLVRANGGHLILDEIDKGPDELTNMNDALEGEQTVDIEKAGQSATYESRTAVMALGNPVDGRFNEHEPIAEQLGISESLLSRFDGIVTMTDSADTEQDERIADTWGRAYTESQAVEYGDREDFETLDRPVPIDVGQAWIKHARENVHPILTYEQFTDLKSWYAEEVRQLNATYAGDGDGGDMPVPATVRELAAAAKMAIAFARVHLRDEVTAADVERAKALGRRLVKQNWTGQSFDAAKNTGGQKFDQLKPRILDALGEDRLFAEEIAREVGVGEEETRAMLDRLSTQGRVIERNGKWEMPL